MTYEKQPGYWNSIKPIKILHFSSTPKPWNNAEKKGDLEMIWWQFYIQSQLFSSGISSCCDWNRKYIWQQRRCWDLSGNW